MSTLTPPAGWVSVENPKEIQECIAFYIAHWPAQHQRMTLRKCLMKMYVDPGMSSCLYMFRSSDWDTNVSQRIAASFYLRRVPRGHPDPDEHGWCLCLATLLEMSSPMELQFVYGRLESLCRWFRTVGALQEVTQDASRVLPPNLQRLFDKAYNDGDLREADDDTMGLGWPSVLNRWEVVF